jgi:polyisoprenoid-binding protein YceI
VALPPGTYTLGPQNGTLAVRTGRTGAAAKAGHNLLLHAMTWEATVTVAEDPAASSVELTVDSSSLRVIEGTGGVQALGDDDKAEIQTTIDDEVLKGQPVTFRSSSVADADGGLQVDGTLTLRGTSAPIGFALTLADGHLKGGATVRQTAWKIKPYSTLFGALKVADEVEVELDAILPSPS